MKSRSIPTDKEFSGPPLKTHAGLGFGRGCRHVDRVTFDNVKVRTAVPDARPAAIWLDDCTEIDQEGFKW